MPLFRCFFNTSLFVFMNRVVVQDYCFYCLRLQLLNKLSPNVVINHLKVFLVIELEQARMSSTLFLEIAISKLYVKGSLFITSKTGLPFALWVDFLTLHTIVRTSFLTDGHHTWWTDTVLDGRKSYLTDKYPIFIICLL